MELVYDLICGCCAGALSRAIEQVIMCFATNKAMVLVGIVFGSFAALLMPASCSLLSKHTPVWEQVLYFQTYGSVYTHTLTADILHH